MKNFNKIIDKLHFKKIIIMYLIFVVIVGIFSVALLGYAYKDKFLFAYDYNKVSEKIESGEFGVDAVKEDITTLASQSSDIVDILILDKSNIVSFSAKNSEFASGEFVLEHGKDGEDHYFTYSQNPNVTFKLIKNDDLMLSAAFYDNETDIENDYDNNTFFENDIHSKEIYLLSYTVDRGTGDKIYFISDIHPVANGSLYIEIIYAVATLFFMLYWILMALWIYQDARKSKLNAVLWGVITLFTNLGGLFIYFIYKQSNQTCFKCGAIQSKGNIYCTYCGTKISKTCSKCNTNISSTDCFCSHCGNNIVNTGESE